MADGTGEAVRSEPMEAIPAFDPRTARPGATSPVAPPPPIEGSEREVDTEGMSLARRLRQPRTILSIAVPIAVIAIFVAVNGAQLSKVPSLVLGANPALVLLAFIVFYAGFPLRGLRWATLLQGTGLRIRTKDSMEIIFLSWLVNCVVPAKLGDVYRAYLLKINSTASLSRTFGTVFIERVLDLFAIASLGLAAGYWSFRDGLPPPIQLVFGIGVVVVVALGIGLFTMRNFGRQIIVALPLPHQVLELYDRFEEGVFGALVARHLPSLGVMTGFIW
ncbi:MAG TPA: lysylphosphatidylglycerol synthase transmembrane domain-containing protein, partial [Candidatus Limnocylindrales bacterium]|nr:lysylphosphatidylglycerol synthase transmembrane domain-containing protein [Candidatus Limnocylindrales bacterium]